VAPADLEAAAAHLERGLVERSAEARLVLLGAVGREHVLFVGPPGVAKSLLCRRLGELFGGPSFEIALTRFTTPDDVFGPLSLAALKDDAYRRAADGFAQEAPAVFFDEIFRARSLLPALLALLNERVWQDGPHRRPAALVSAVAAANSLGGDDDDDDDDALYDRFLIRREVAPVSDAAVADLLLGDDVDGACPRAFLAPLLDVPRPPRAALPRFFAELLGDARAFLRDRGDYVSDRRLRKCADLVRVAARANGRGAVGPLQGRTRERNSQLQRLLSRPFSTRFG
jgi:MoxR-like ATPase